MRKLTIYKNLPNQNTPQVELGYKFSEWNFYEDIHLAENLTRFRFKRPTHLPSISTKRTFVVQESAPERKERKINKNIVYLHQDIEEHNGSESSYTENLFSHFESIEEYRTASVTRTTWS